MPELLTLPIIAVAIALLYILSVINILPEYERGVIFRLGRLLPEPKGPGIILVFRPIDRIVRISLRTVVLDVPPQDVITRDNVTVSVNAVVYFRVINPLLAVVEELTREHSEARFLFVGTVHGPEKAMAEHAGIPP